MFIIKQITKYKSTHTKNKQENYYAVNNAGHQVHSRIYILEYSLFLPIENRLGKNNNNPTIYSSWSSNRKDAILLHYDRPYCKVQYRTLFRMINFFHANHLRYKNKSTKENRISNGDFHSSWTTVSHHHSVGTIYRHIPIKKFNLEQMEISVIL